MKDSLKGKKFESPLKGCIYMCDKMEWGRTLLDISLYCGDHV